MALGSTQPLTEIQKLVPGVFPGSKGGRCLRLTTLPPSCAVVMKFGNLNFLEPSGQLQACNGTALPFFLQCTKTGIQVLENNIFYRKWNEKVMVSFKALC